ncbi:MAG: GTPase domain-containing protein [Candidatus Sericytochromatia bacterium]|nr:GTPase domain-containing protein [Candidatus Sericytochromatia bacterium]
MALINYATREVNCKIVYYGTGLGGKTTNLEFIHKQVPPHVRGEMVNLATPTERTLYFDFLSLDLGSVQGFKTRFALYTVPGQVEYNASRKLILNGVDGIVFVADSQISRWNENIESMRNMAENLAEYGLKTDEVPWVLQLNKRDLPQVSPIDELNRALNPKGVPHFAAAAHQGLGVFDTLKAVSRSVLTRLS